MTEIFRFNIICSNTKILCIYTFHYRRLLSRKENYSLVLIFFSDAMNTFLKKITYPTFIDILQPACASCPYK